MDQDVEPGWLQRERDMASKAVEKLSAWFNEERPSVDLVRPEAFDKAWDEATGVKPSPWDHVEAGDALKLSDYGDPWIAQALAVQERDADPINLL